MSLQNTIEMAFEHRAEITPTSVSAEVKEAVLETVRQLDSGVLRVAEKKNGHWQVNEWRKRPYCCRLELLIMRWLMMA